MHIIVRTYISSMIKGANLASAFVVHFLYSNTYPISGILKSLKILKVYHNKNKPLNSWPILKVS